MGEVHSCTLLRAINKFVCALSTFIVQNGRDSEYESCTSCSYASLSYTEISTGKDIKFLMGINSQGIFYFSIASGMALVPNESPLSTEVSFLGGKMPEASSACGKNTQYDNCTHPHIFMALCLIKHFSITLVP
jgi:hypothetical protein